MKPIEVRVKQPLPCIDTTPISDLIFIILNVLFTSMYQSIIPLQCTLADRLFPNFCLMNL